VHLEAMTWLQQQVAALAPAERGTVIDLGGRDINGSPRVLFPMRTKYTVIDLHEGPNVDVVADCREWDPEEKVDVVISAEVLEHADDPKAILDAAARWLKQGGLLLCTAAAEPRTPHSALDGGPLHDGEHYANIDPEQLASWLDDGPWYPPAIEHDQVHGDVYVKVQRR
jgi:SAM-dependent methyltransferase